MWRRKDITNIAIFRKLMPRLDTIKRNFFGEHQAPMLTLGTPHILQVKCSLDRLETRKALECSQ